MSSNHAFLLVTVRESEYSRCERQSVWVHVYGSCKHKMSFLNKIWFFFVAGLLLSLPRVTVQQCPGDTPVRVRYNQTVSLLAIPIDSSIPGCSGSSNFSECCLCDNDDELACLSLDGALVYINNVVQTSSIIGAELILGVYNGESTIILSSSFNIHSLYQLTITGIGNVNVTCADGAGIAFNASTSITIHNILWKGCGPIAVLSTDKTHGPLASGLAFIDCARVTLTDTHFESFCGSAVLFYAPSMPNVSCSSETCTSAVVTKQQMFEYRIERCSFVGNGRMITQSDKLEAKGGAICIALKTSHPNSISIVDTQFKSNMATDGGAIFYSLSGIVEHDYFRQSQFFIRNSYFLGNRALAHGGALLINGVGGDYHNCTFDGNHASVGGAIYYNLLSNTPLCEEGENEANLTFQSCTWTSNQAQTSATFYLGVTSGTSLINISFTESNFTGNTVSQFYYTDEPTCIVYLFFVNVVLDSFHATSNYGTALCLDSANIVFKGNNSFVGNQGFEGGGIYIHSSRIGLFMIQVLSFVHNTAFYGGAIFSNIMLQNSPGCIFEFISENETDEKNTTVKFVNNTAFISGNSVYFLANAMNFCQQTFERDEFDFIPKNANQISSPAQTVNYLQGPDNINVTLGIGIQLTVNVQVLDFINQPTTTVINAILQDDLNQTTPYKIVSSSSFTINDGTNTLNLTIVGPQVTEEFLSPYDLTLVTANSRKSMQINFLPCPLGMLYNESEQKCVCNEQYDELLCDPNTATLCIHNSYWVGMVNGNYTVALCSLGGCSSAYGACIPCFIENGIDYCRLTGSQSDCSNDHGGTLCAMCKDGFTPSFLSIHCISNSTCSYENGFYMFVINMAFCATVLCLFIIVLKLDYRIGSGYLYGVFYYYSIAIHLLPSNTDVVGEPMLVTVAVMMQLTQLNPRVIGYFDLCTSKDTTIILQYALCFLNILVLAFLVLVVLWMSKRCTNVVAFSDSTPVRAICLLAISSFGTLTETSFNIISPVIFKGLSRVYVNIQPSVEYLDSGQHLPWFIISVLVLLLLIVPFTLLLFLAPILVRCINMNCIKPFLDEFQGCYKDKFRWMAGYYFLCRIIYLALLTSASAGLKETQYIVQLFSLFVLMFHVSLQPYKSSFLNTIDSLFLADMVILALLFGQTAEVVFVEHSAIRVALAFSLVLIPIFYVLFLAVLALLTKLSQKYAFLNSCFFQTFKMPDTGMTENQSMSTLHQSSTLDQDGLTSIREPLLSFVQSTQENSSPSSRIRGAATSLQHRTFAKLLTTTNKEPNTETKSQTVIERPVIALTDCEMHPYHEISSD